MSQQESMETKLARIEQRLIGIETYVQQHTPLRHMKDGVCDAWGTVIEHDRRINRGIGFVAAISMFFSMLGGVIVLVVSKLWRP